MMPADNGWAGLLIVIAILIYGLVLSLYGNRFYKRLKLLNAGRTRIVEYDENVASWFFVALLWIAAVCSMAMTVSIVIARLSHTALDVTTFLVVLGVSGAYIGIKFGVMYLMKYVFDMENYIFIEEMKMIVVMFGLASALTGLGLAYYSNIWVGTIFCAVALLSGFILEAVLLFKNFYNGIGSLLYIFLYLCAAEILPLIVGAKWILQVLN